MRWLALVALLTFGCDSEQGAAQAQVSDAAAGASDAEGLLPVPGGGGDVSGGAGGEAGSAAGAPGAGGTSAADARAPDPQAGGAGGGVVPVVNRCTVIPSISSHCGYLNARFEAVDRQLNGLRCRTCTVEDAGKLHAVTGCSPQPGGGICVEACSACCYDVANSVCDSDRDCCAPLRCVPVGTGMVKACR